MTSSPSIAVLILNRNGRDDLGACLTSVRSQEFDGEPPAIEVVDQGSTDGSTEFVRQRFPDVRVLDLKGNIGFSTAYNIAVKRARTDFVALLGSQTRVHKDWLAELLSTAERTGASAVASKIVDWTGARVEFAGGSLSFTGHSWPRGNGEPANTPYAEEEMLYASGASSLFERTAFLETGGFDEDFFACLEDVDFGWRLNLRGHKVVFAPTAVTYRRAQRTSEWDLPSETKTRLLERNALAMIFKNYSQETLNRILPAAVALSLTRGLIGSGIDTLQLDFQSRPQPVVEVQTRLLAHLMALEDFCGQLPSLSARRRAIQQTRERTDTELFPLFGDPLNVAGGGDRRLEQVARALTRDFAIDDVTSPSGLQQTPRAPVRAAGPRDAEAWTPKSGKPNPKVSVVILTALGTLHLRECLASLRAQNYPPDLCEVIVVDNGSPTPVDRQIEGWYPGVRVISSATNLGFARGNNVGARSASGQYLVFLNDDTRVHPDWLRELVATARRRNAAGVAACMLDWEGRTLDFVGGAVNFEGKGFQLDYGANRDRLHPDEKPLLFACGGAMLVDRAVFQEAGGWDDEAFAYYEDVELGWRLNMLGHQVWFCPGAIVFHKHHGTSGQWAEPPRIRLYERNSLRMIYSLLEVDSLARVLPAALMLTADRALLATGLGRATGPMTAAALRRPVVARAKQAVKAALISRGVNRQMSVVGALRHLGIRGLAGSTRDLARILLRSATRTRQSQTSPRRGTVSPDGSRLEGIPLPVAAIMAGVLGFLEDLPGLSLRRQELQKRRVVTDAEILAAFGTEWTSPCGSARPEDHQARHYELVGHFGLAELAAAPARVDQNLTTRTHTADPRH